MRYWITLTQLETLGRLNPEWPDSVTQRDALVSQIRLAQSLDEEFLDNLDRASAAHQEEFDHWYETANFPSIKACCLLGWTLNRLFR